MRIKNSLKNISVSIIAQLVIALLSYISRGIFISTLGNEYLGVNAILTSVISMLSLVESGIGISIVYNLYKPLAEKDENKIIALVKLYKKAYGILAIIIGFLSICIYPFLKYLISDTENVSYIGVVYFLFVAKNMISYFNAHKWSLINADQKEYVLARINLCFQIVTTIGKILILITTQNYILYLFIELIIFAIQNIYNGKVVTKRYPYILKKGKYEIDVDTKKNIVQNIKALFLHNIGSYCVFGTDNILIAAFKGSIVAGLYSNYSMIITQVTALINPFLNGIGASVGNLLATEEKEKSYDIFKSIYLVNFWVYSFSVISLFILLEPVIEWGFGKNLLLDRLTFFVILINFYVTGMRSCTLIFKTKAGIFVQDKYVTLIEAAVNLICSITLVKYFGLAGIFIGTLISTVSIVFWNVPRLVYKHVFKEKLIKYFIKYALYFMLTLFAGTVTYFINSIIFSNFVEITFISIVIKGILCLIIPNTIYLALFYKTEEFQYLIKSIKAVIGRKK